MSADEVVHHYTRLDYESTRLAAGTSRLEFARTREILERRLPAPPSRVLDVGGGPGAYACWLAARGYEVHLVDLVPLHVEQARAASARQPETPVRSLEVGDARELSQADCSVDVVLLLGPLYHLEEREDRARALAEAYRVLRPQGLLFAVGISRFASTLDGLTRGMLRDDAFFAISRQDLENGRHQNPMRHPDYFTTAYFHHPDELTAEIGEAGFGDARLTAIEGPAWILQDFDDWWAAQATRDRLLAAVASIETEPTLIGSSAHIMVTAAKP